MARTRLIHLLISLLCMIAAATLLFTGDGRLVRAELRASDWVARYGRKAPRNDKVVFLAIDDQSRSIRAEEDLKGLYADDHLSPDDERALRMMGDSWPWDRSVYALVLERLFGAGASLVVFDMVFDTRKPEDPAFRATLEKYHDRVVVGCNFVDSAADPENALPSLTRPTPTLIAPSTDPDDRLGFVNYWVDADEVVRDATFRASLLSISKRFLPGDELFSSLAAQAVAKLGHPGLIPTDAFPHTLRLTDFPGRAFPPHPIFEVFAPRYWESNYHSGDLFRGAVVVIGAYGSLHHDELQTTLGMMPGPELQCNSINALLHGAFVRRVSFAVCLGLIGGAGILALMLAFFVPPPLLRACLFVLIGGLYLGAVFLAYNSGDLVLPLATPLAVLAGSGSLGLLWDFGAVRRDRKRLRSTFERYVSKNVVGEMLERPDSYLHDLGGRVQPVTILFSDIRNFTRVCANTDSHTLVQLLNEYLTVMVDCAFRYRGTLDKFIGDAIMVVFGNVASQGAKEDARQAFRCALAMQDELEKLNERGTREGRGPIHIGIALNHGEVVAGNIGSPHRMEFTVIGDAVNVCWRLQERTKLHPGGFILGETMLPFIEKEFPLEKIGSLIVGETLESDYYCLASALQLPEIKDSDAAGVAELVEAV